MKTLKKWVLSVFALVVVYIVNLFVFPQFMQALWEKVWLSGVNNHIFQLREDIDNFVQWIDILHYKQKALEVKQNVESQVDDTRKKIEDIQIKVDETGKAIEQTKDSINQTVNTLGELWNTIGNIIPSSSTTSSWIVENQE